VLMPIWLGKFPPKSPRAVVFQWVFPIRGGAGTEYAQGEAGLATVPDLNLQPMFSRAPAGG